MAGTKIGGLKARKTNLERHGADYYKRIGKMSGSQCRPETRYFYRHPEAAQLAGAKGGRKSKRGPKTPESICSK